MSSHMLLIDGYNVIYKIDSLKSEMKRDLQNARKKLAIFLNSWKQQCGYKGRIAVVFDGQSATYLDSVESCNGIKFYYSYRDSDADNHIIAMIKSHSCPSTITVITDDNYIKNHCKVYGARTEPVSYLNKAKKKQPHVKETDLSRKEIPPKHIEDINEYVRKKWGIT
jgi:predicted RNA-binding protein with PIN domain